VSEDASYVIRTGAGARDRLDLIARLFWPTTEPFLTRNDALGGGRFLDVGCGIGDVASRIGGALGIDVNAEVIDAARERCDGTGASATFRVAGLSDLGDDDYRDFDVVYARCVLSHQSDPRTAIAHMLAAARPGGRVLLEDVEVAAVWSSPANAALTRHLDLYVAAARGLGAQPDVGAELAPLLTDLGATDVHVDIVQPVLRIPADLRAHACTMEAIARPVIDQGLALADEVAALVAQLEEFALTPGVVATLPRIIQVSAFAPEDPI
jgi:SAM-dependent methyltransferase